jgi:NitT/TauT family transport system substrate-binding protein
MRKSRVRVAALLLVVGAVAAVGGCKKDQPAAGMPPSEVRLGYFPNVTHAQAVLGVASGEFQQAIGSSKLSTKTFNAGPSLVEALFANEIDIGYIGPSPVLNGFSRSKGRGLRVVAGGAANGVLVVARKDSGIKRLEDLKGRKVATPQLGNTQDVSAKHYLKYKLGDDLSNVRPIANAEQAGMMSRGEVDAAWAVEPWGSFLVSQANAEVIGHEKDLWPEGKFVLTVVITTPEFLQNHPDVVEKMLTVHRSWTARLQEDPQKHLPALGAGLFEITRKKLPDGVLASALKNVEFTDEPLESSFATFDQWSRDLGFTKETTDLKNLVDATILRKLQQSAGTRPATGPVAGASEGAR